MPCHAIACHAMPCHARPCHAMPCQPCHAMAHKHYKHSVGHAMAHKHYKHSVGEQPKTAGRPTQETKGAICLLLTSTRMSATTVVHGHYQPENWHKQFFFGGCQKAENPGTAGTLLRELLLSQQEAYPWGSPLLRTQGGHRQLPERAHVSHVLSTEVAYPWGS